MRQRHANNADCGNHLFQRAYLGNGKYFQRGICKGIEVGDEFYSHTEPKRLLHVSEIKKREDAKGVFEEEEDRVLAYYEAELIDKSYTPDKYVPLHQFGRIK